MKQFLKIFLAIALVLSFLIISEKAFAQDDSYVLHEDGGSVKYATDDAESLVDYMKNF